MTALTSCGLLAGRLCIAAIYLISGTEKVSAYSALAENLARKGLPAPDLLAVCAIVAELGGALLVAFGFRPRFGALVLLIFTAAATVMFHDFWNVSGAAREDQLLHFLKNLAIFGGLLVLAISGGGDVSLDRLIGGRRPAGANRRTVEERG